jgi:hypothetical protein
MAIYVNTTPPVTRPSLLLDFANSKTVDRRITFTRSSSATYYDSQGILRYAVTDQPRIDHDPSTSECRGLLIEEQRANLQTYSEQFNNSAWTKVAVTVSANTAISPDGTITADTVSEDNTTDFHIIGNAISFVSGTTYTFSVFAKAKERNFARILFGNSAFPANRYVVLNLTTGEINKSSDVTASATALSNGWYRLIGTFTANATASERMWFGPAAALNSAYDTYAGTPGHGIYLWGAQLEAGSFATSYIPSTVTFTSRASSATYVDSSGILKIADINQPRYGYGYDSVSGKWISQGLILESAVTNLHTNGTTFSNWSRQGNVTLTPNSAIGPDGRLSAATVTTVSSTFLGFYDVGIGGGTSYLANTAYTASIFVKAVSGVTQIYGGLTNQFEGASAYYTFNLSSKAITSGSSGGFTAAGATLTELANGWFRISVTGITGASGFNSTTSIGAFWRNAEIGTAYYYGAQYEVGSSPTSYIPTFGSAVTRSADSSSSSATTRAADVANVTTLTPWYNNTEGSFLFDFNQVNVGAIASIGDDTFNNSLRFNTLQMARGVGTGFATIVLLGSAQIGSNKLAVAIKANDYAGVFNGGAVSTQNPASMVPPPTIFGLGKDYSTNAYMTGWLRRVAYYPRRLTNTQLQALTK